MRWSTSRLDSTRQTLVTFVNERHVAGRRTRNVHTPRNSPNEFLVKRTHEFYEQLLQWLLLP